MGKDRALRAEANKLNHNWICFSTVSNSQLFN